MKKCPKCYQFMIAKYSEGEDISLLVCYFCPTCQIVIGRDHHRTAKIILTSK